jgi:hypothetical protein
VAEQSNQHFVPKFYFRRFNGGSECIHLLHQRSERIILGAGIRGQCARNKFYSNGESETPFSAVEGGHARTLQYLSEAAWSRTEEDITLEHYNSLLHAILFQRARTLLEIEKDASTIESMTFEMFKEHVRNSPGIEDRDALLEQLESGNIRIKIGQRWVARTSITTMLNCADLITDLDYHLLRNHTTLPFIFGDSPVVFCNTLYQNVKNRGVLGLQTPGLQILFPIDPKTTVMLIDDSVYGGRYREPFLVDVYERCDVSQLNALQMHNSLDAIYFGDQNDQQYIMQLWDAHKSNIKKERVEFRDIRGWLHNGTAIRERAWNGFDAHLNFRLSLSFIDCKPIRPEQYQFRRRSPELYKEHMARTRRASLREWRR